MVGYRAVVGWALLLASIPASGRAADWPPRDGMRVVFLGDSITQFGLYVRYVDAHLPSRYPRRRVEAIGLGLSSETLAGTSEPGHPYPRLDVRSRLPRAPELARPDLVFACCGMNDGFLNLHPVGHDGTSTRSG